MNGLDLKVVWDWLNGKKTKIAMLCLFAYGGLAYLNYDLVWLKYLGESLGGVGLLHAVVKKDYK